MEFVKVRGHGTPASDSPAVSNEVGFSGSQRDQERPLTSSTVDSYQVKKTHPDLKSKKKLDIQGFPLIFFSHIQKLCEILRIQIGNCLTPGVKCQAEGPQYS